jgi:hypothetical protein
MDSDFSCDVGTKTENGFVPATISVRCYLGFAPESDTIETHGVGVRVPPAELTVSGCRHSTSECDIESSLF